jgi:UDP-GlcNAc3NAcA epimerase
MLKLVTIIGARPQMIKAAAISRAIRTEFTDQIEEIIIHTGQHYDTAMSQVFFDELQIPKEKYNLEIGSGSHALQTAKMMIAIEEVLLKERPNVLLLYGDTNSTLAACLTAAKLFIPIVHVEAGVRGYNKYFPEEVNRLITDHLSSLLFVPTKSGMESLSKENVVHHSISQTKPDFNTPAVYLTGDIMYDNTMFFSQVSDHKKEELHRKFNLPESFVLLTIHRPSNVDDSENLLSILHAVEQISTEFKVSFVFPVHPRTRFIIESNTVLSQLIKDLPIVIIPPVSFIEMIYLEKTASLVMTDSGGVQKEAYFLKKPALILLEETPWLELIESGNAILTGNNTDKIYNAYKELTTKELNFDQDLYGDGKASSFIVSKIVDHFNV